MKGLAIALAALLAATGVAGADTIRVARSGIDDVDGGFTKGV